MGSFILGKKLSLLACLLCFSFITVVKANATVEGTVFIDGKTPISTTDENFDLKNNILLNAVKAFSHLRLRLGGTLQDKVIYQTEDHQIPCVPFVQNSSELFGYTEGCFSLARWDELISFFNQTGALITFGLNALSGKVILRNSTATGPWRSENAASFIRYTVKKGYNIYGWELGNELGGLPLPITVHVSVIPYASDTNTLYGLIQEIYQNISIKPHILAPGGVFEHNWFRQYIDKAKSVNVITHHIYNLGAGTAEQLIGRILDPSFLDNGTSVYEDLQKIIEDSRTSVSAWVGEAGGIYNSGRDTVSNAFVNSFWYLDQLGMASSYGTKAYCRQTLIGGNYGLLNTTTFVPNPDYYSAFLWHQLMGRYVLSTNFTGTRKVRAYAHCAKKSEGVTVLLINLDVNTAVKAELNFNNTGTKVNSFGGTTREEYHLTPLEGNIQSQTVLLNGKALTLGSSGAIPALKPLMVHSTNPMVVAPSSIVFVHMPNVAVAACKN